MKFGRLNGLVLASLMMAGVLPFIQAEEGSKLRYTISEGRGSSVCDGYLKVLNSIHDELAYPICEQRLSPHFKDLREPGWEILDPMQNLDAVYAIEQDLASAIRDANKNPLPEFESWKAEFAQRIKEGNVPHLRRASLKLVADGPLETVLAYESGLFACDKQLAAGQPPFPGGGAYLYLFDTQTQSLDKKSAGQFSRVPRELLIYQGRPLLFSTYVASYNADVAGHIIVKHFNRYVPPNASAIYLVEQRCRIRFDWPEKLRR